LGVGLINPHRKNHILRNQKCRMAGQSKGGQGLETAVVPQKEEKKKYEMVS
jgi:hypothetical protein